MLIYYIRVPCRAFDYTQSCFLLSREAALKMASHTPLFSSTSKYPTREKYPNVYDQMEEARQSSAFVGGTKVGYTFYNGLFNFQAV